MAAGKASGKEILIASGPWDPLPWAEAVRAIEPARQVVIWPDVPDPSAIGYVMAWHPPPEALAGLPNLAVIFSLGAGVEHILSGEALPDVPVVRIVSDDLTRRMTEWVTLQVLMHHRQQRRYDRLQHDRRWHELRQPAASEVRVGIMGMGVLGKSAAEVLVKLGFQVAGWSRRAKTVARRRVLPRRRRPRSVPGADRHPCRAPAADAGDARPTVDAIVQQARP